MTEIHEPVEDDIRRLQAIRNETRIWSIGSFIAIVVILVIGMSVVATSANRLFQPGPAQDEFAADLGSDLNNNVTPTLQTIAGQALTESQPAIQAQFTKLGDRVPDLSTAFLAQFNILQQDLPKQGDAIVNASFGQVLTDQEPKIESMCPGVTDSSVQSMVANVSDQAQNQFLLANSTLFAKHEAALNGIMQDIDTIHSTEKIGGDSDKANLDMAISVIEAFHSDMTTMDNAHANDSEKGNVTL